MRARQEGEYNRRIPVRDRVRRIGYYASTNDFFRRVVAGGSVGGLGLTAIGARDAAIKLAAGLAGMTLGHYINEQRVEKKARELFWKRVDEEDVKAEYTRVVKEQNISVEEDYFEYTRREDRRKVVDLMENAIEQMKNNNNSNRTILVGEWSISPDRRVILARQEGDVRMEIDWLQQRRFGKRDRYFIRATEIREPEDPRGQTVIYAVSIDEVTDLYNKIFAIQ